MKLNELVNVLCNVKINVLLKNCGAKSIYNGSVAKLKSNKDLKNYRVICVLHDIEKDLVILVEEAK